MRHGDCQLLIPIDTRTSTTTASDRIVLSFLREQALGVQRHVEPSLDGHSYIHAVQVFDDANMWAALPVKDRPANTLAESAASVESAKKIRRRERGARMMHSPVLNSIETLVVHEVPFVPDPGAADPAPPPPRSQTRACRISSPCQVLPKANYATIDTRRNRWAVMNGSGRAGESVDPSSVVALPACAWKNISCVRDCLNTNANIIWCLEERSRARRVALPPNLKDGVDTIYNHNCGGHSLVLCCKPTISWIAGLSKFVVQFGHMCQSSRQHESMQSTLRREFDKGFRFRPTAVPPPDFEAWRAKNLEILTLSSVTCDLPKEVIDLIVYYDNFRWDQPLSVHICLPGCLCGGAEHVARERLWSATLWSVGPDMQLALEYRWKGMERGCGYVYRSRSQHDYGFRMVAGMYRKKEVEEAAAAVAAAGAGADISAARQTLKVGQVYTYMVNDPAGLSCLKALLLMQPIQKALNDALAAEAATSKYVNSLVRNIRGQTLSEGAHATQLNLRDDAIKKNLVFLGGDRGEKIIEDYAILLGYFDHPDWRNYRERMEEAATGSGRPTQFRAALQCVCVVGGVWRRAVFVTIDLKASSRS